MVPYTTQLYDFDVGLYDINSNTTRNHLLATLLLVISLILMQFRFLYLIIYRWLIRLQKYIIFMYFQRKYQL